jgi:hypothetical protein
MITGFLAALLLFPRMGPGRDNPGIQRCGPVEVEGVVLTVGTHDYLSAAVRTKGTLTDEGVWCLKLLHVTDTQGSEVATDYPMAAVADVKTDSFGPMTGSHLKAKSVPEKVRIEGELVHCETVEETATFPAVHLYTKGDLNSTKDKPMRDWFIPDDLLVGTKTERGLALTYEKLNGYGYSGPGYSDLSRLPVKVIPETVNVGVESELRLAGASGVERIDAYTEGHRVQIIYQKDPPVNGKTFSFVDKDFQSTVALTLHITRLIPDQRYAFSLVVPVQMDKNMFERQMGKPDPAKFVVWPSSRPDRLGT